MGVECVDWFGVVALDFLDPRALLASDHCPPPSHAALLPKPPEKMPATTTPPRLDALGGHWGVLFRYFVMGLLAGQNISVTLVANLLRFEWYLVQDFRECQPYWVGQWIWISYRAYRS